MRKSMWLGLVISLIGLSAPAQQVIPLSKVKAIRVPEESSNEPHQAAIDGAIIREIQRSGQFKVVFGDKEPADARLSIVYGCNPLTGLPIPEINMPTPNGLCAIALFKPDSPKDKPEMIWMTPPWRVAEIHLELNGEPKDKWVTALAERHVAELVTAWKLSQEGKFPPTPLPLQLKDVKTIHVSSGSYNYQNLEDVSLEKLLFERLVSVGKDRQGSKEKQVAAGSSDTGGFASMLPGVKLVSVPAQADAILLSIHPLKYKGPVQFSSQASASTTVDSEGSSASTTAWTNGTIWQNTYRVGGAFLLDRRTLQKIWSATEDDYSRWGWSSGLVSYLHPRAGGDKRLADRLVKQLKKDWQEAANSR